MCLQRHIWRECGGLDAKGHLPFSREDLFCGYTPYADVIAFPEKYNKSHCFVIENMMSFSECEQIFKKLFTDLVCVRRVRESFLKLTLNSSKMRCNCPEPCEAFMFDTTYSLAAWPVDGPQLEESYRKIVLEEVIPFFKGFGDKKYKTSSEYAAVLNNLIKYLSDSTKKKEIMSNFLRLTVYIKNLAVETIEDVVGYSEVDLLSDIGK